MARILFRQWIFSSLVFLLAWTSAPLYACPFCASQGKSLRSEAQNADMVLLGTLKAQPDPDGALGQGTTRLHVEVVLKHHEILNQKQDIVLLQYLPKVDSDKFLVFCSVIEGKIDAYRFIPAKDSNNLVKYVQGILALQNKPAGERLRYAFAYLDHSDPEISEDAYREFATTPYKDCLEMAKQLPADKIIGWLEDPKTPKQRFGLYGLLLGHCGTEKHAAYLRKLLDDPEKRPVMGLDGLLSGYVLLQPKEGWAYVCDILKDTEPKRVWLRYAALRAARFFWDDRADIVSKDEIVQKVCLLLDQGDMADLAIEDLRKWGRWEVADKVLSLYGKKTHDQRTVHRAIMLYALSCPNNPRTLEFANKVREKDPELVKNAEDLLRMEKDQPQGKK